MCNDPGSRSYVCVPVCVLSVGVDMCLLYTVTIPPHSETATGILFSLNVPETSVPLCKSLSINFNKRAQGEAIVARIYIYIYIYVCLSLSLSLFLRLPILDR